MALGPRMAPSGRPEDLCSGSKCLGSKRSKKAPARRSRPKAKSAGRTGAGNDPPSGKRPKRKGEDTPERAQKKALKRKKKKALWSRNHRKTHKAELRDYQRAWRARKREDPKFVEKERKKNRICSRKKRYATYGMTIADYNVMKAQQGGVCLICKGKRRRKRKPNPKRKNKDRRRHNGKRLCVDHCHKLKMVRGLLCGRCNCMIGYGDDDPRILNEGRKYLIAFLKSCASKEKKR